MQVKYIVKKEDGVVVCIGEDVAFDVVKDLGYNLAEVTRLKDIMPYIIRDSFKGVAKLSGGDKWNEAVGKKVAYAKMKNKYLTAKSKVVDRLLGDVMETVAGLSSILDSYEDKMLPVEG